MDNRDNRMEEMYQFVLKELEFHSRQQTHRAVLFGFVGGVIGFSLCMILVALTVKPEPEPPKLEPSVAIHTREIRI